MTAIPAAMSADVIPEVNLLNPWKTDDKGWGFNLGEITRNPKREFHCPPKELMFFFKKISYLK